MNSIAFAVIVLVVLGLAGGIILVLASKFMRHRALVWLMPRL